LKEGILVLMMLVPVVYLLLNWDALPGQMPIHWDLQGNVNGWGSRWVFPLVEVGLYALLLVLPMIDPLKKNYEIFGDTYYKLRFIMVAFFSATNMCVMVNELYHNMNIGKLVSSSVFLLFALLGNYMGNLRRNYFIGYKLPWTLESDEVWRKTHKFASILWFWGGLLGFVLSIANLDFNYVMVSIISVIAIVPMIYAYKIRDKYRYGKP